MDVSPIHDSNPPNASPIPDSSPILNASPMPDSSSSDATCHYDCQSNGSCSVRIQSSGLLQGHTLGSCFSPAFGGACSGIPERLKFEKLLKLILLILQNY